MPKAPPEKWYWGVSVAGLRSSDGALNQIEGLLINPKRALGVKPK